jgi:hypothetical protein
LRSLPRDASAALTNCGSGRAVRLLLRRFHAEFHGGLAGFGDDAAVGFPKAPPQAGMGRKARDQDHQQTRYRRRDCDPHQTVAVHTLLVGVPRDGVKPVVHYECDLRYTLGTIDPPLKSRPSTPAVGGRAAEDDRQVVPTHPIKACGLGANGLRNGAVIAKLISLSTDLHPSGSAVNHGPAGRRRRRPGRTGVLANRAFGLLARRSS